MQPKVLIKCPHCGWEYLPGEIYLGNALIGQPKDVIRDALGKIIYNEGDEPDYVEHFCCEGCGRDFVVEAAISYKSKPEEEELDFSNEFVSLLDK